MKDKKRGAFTVSDIAVTVIIAAAALFSLIPGAFAGRTERIVYEIAVDGPGRVTAGPGDRVISLGGGILGTVTEVSDGRITVETDAASVSGVYYSDGVAVKSGAKYDFAVNAYHMKGTVEGPVTVKNEE